jgi:predicted RNase H-like HicB family nuclease
MNTTTPAAKYYVAIIEGGDTPGFSVFFPDLPGCTSGGDTIDEAARNAQEALGLHLWGMLEFGEEVPAPTPYQDIPHDPEIREAARVLVPADVAGKTIRLNISLDEGVVALADRKAAANGFTRSGYIASLIRQDAMGVQRAAPARSAKPKLKPAKRRRTG